MFRWTVIGSCIGLGVGLPAGWFFGAVVATVVAREVPGVDPIAVFAVAGFALVLLLGAVAGSVGCSVGRTRPHGRRTGELSADAG